MLRKFCLIWFILIATFTLLLARTNAWQIVSRMPVAVRGAQAVEHNGLIYILGGYSDSTYSATKLIQVYDPVANSWQVLPDTLKIPRYGFSADNYHNSVLMFGSEFAADSSLEMWDFSGATYFYDYRNVFSRQFAACQVLGDHLYIFGGLPGVGGKSIPYLVEYFVPGAQIAYTRASSFDEQQYPPDQTDIIQQISAAIGDKIYLFGGALNGILNTIYRFDATTHQFTKLDDVLTVSRAAGAAVSFESGQIVVLGGYNERTPALASTEYFVTNFSGDLGYSEMLNDLNIGRSELCAVGFQDSLIFVFGGKDLLGHCVAEVEKIRIWTSPTALKNQQGRVPSNMALLQNYPNPFNQQTVIPFTLDERRQVKLTLYDITGREIITLINRSLAPGRHRVQWNGLDAQGHAVSSGIYFYRLQSATLVQTRQLILMR